jgi:hypothetical protein
VNSFYLGLSIWVLNKFGFQFHSVFPEGLQTLLRARQSWLKGWEELLLHALSHYRCGTEARKGNGFIQGGRNVLLRNLIHLTH